jgi:hypothetical protein
LGETFNFQSNPEPARTLISKKETSSGSQQDERKDEHDGIRKAMECYSPGRESDGVLFFKKALLKDYYLDYYFLEARMINISSPLFVILHSST